MESVGGLPWGGKARIKDEDRPAEISVPDVDTHMAEGGKEEG